jgi:hypothetical protein
MPQVSQEAKLLEPQAEVLQKRQQLAAAAEPAREALGQTSAKA